MLKPLPTVRSLGLASLDLACLSRDLDGDGFDPCAEGPEVHDCDDRVATVNPSADERCNGVDDDCDGETDEDAGPAGWVCVPATGPDGFVMGSPDDEPDRGDHEVQHRVEITRPFLMQDTEVTQAQWEAVAVAQEWQTPTPSTFDGCGDCPVENITRADAIGYVNLLSAAEGLDLCYDAMNLFIGVHCNGYRLPTEAEWEYSVRAGTTTAFYNGGITDTACGDATLMQIGWFCGNGNSMTHPVGALAANPWGLYDMLGNVQERVQDGYNANWYAMSNSIDPVGPSTATMIISRGGSFWQQADDCRAASRRRYLPSFMMGFSGLRPARTKY